MRVVLDASAAAKPTRTGIGHYVTRLAEALLEADPGLALVLGVRLGRWRRRSHVWRPTNGAGARVVLRWFPSSWPSLRLPRADVAHGPDERLVGVRGPEVVTIHDLFSLKSPRWSDAAFRDAKRRRHAQTAARAARVLVPSNATARDVTELLGIEAGRIVVAPHGVGRAFHPVEASIAAPVLARLGVREPYVLFVGRTQPRKNLEAIVTVFARLAARDDALSLVIAGPDGYPPGRLASLIKETGAVERVRQLGYTQDVDLPALYSRARALLFPSRDEGFGLPVLEAMACGCPTVVSDQGALPEVAGDGAYAFGPDAFDDLEDGCRRLLEDEDARRAEIARGLARAAEFSWARSAQATLAAYRAAIAASSSAAT